MNQKLICNCKRNAEIAHTLSQSMMVIHAYVTGCKQRLKENVLDQDQLMMVFDKINQHVELMSNTVHGMLGEETATFSK